EVDGKKTALAAAGSHFGKKGGKAPDKGKGADRPGKANAHFELPQHIQNGAKLIVQRKDGASKTKEVPIPVIPSRLTVDFYPEGGDLIEGVPSRVYYRVRTPLGEPAAPEGHVILLLGNEVLDLPRNQGVGVFAFTPDSNETYKLRVPWPKAPD